MSGKHLHRFVAVALGAAILLAAADPSLAGFPIRGPNVDVLPGFLKPPAGYGEVAFYWWLGDPLTKERLTWHLDRLAHKGVSALQVNYAHSDKGGRSYGLTYASDPPLFSGEWWDLFGWFLKEARKRGMAASLSDYTLGWAGNGWYMDAILRDNPGINGSSLQSVTHACAGGVGSVFTLAAAPLALTAYQTRDGVLDAKTAIDLRPLAAAGQVRWTAPAGNWRVVEVYAKPEPISLDPMHPLSGRQMIAKFFQPFEDRNPGESGRGLNFFFSDELNFGIRGWLWNVYFAGEFRKRKGYDVVPELAALFSDIGPRTPKIRLDYSDVMVALEEENYFRPLYEWHHSRGMLYGCDHGGRGTDVTEFGDYFRTQRWMTAPGNDQPNLTSDVIKNKVSSSIAHLYERQRTWLEGYYGSGWGTTSAQLADATWRNYAQGQNLLTLHGLYYSTHGGWWEWAPPCNHFRMPYWEHMDVFLHAVERMSYVLSQGVHRADVAVLYPVAAVEGGAGGAESVQTAFEVGRSLYGRNIDFDFMDFESLARATVAGRELRIAGEAYRVLVVPAMRTVRYSTIEKALEFQRGGGLVIFLGALPEASERVGREDNSLNAMVQELSGPTASRAKTPGDAQRTIEAAFSPDATCASKGASVLHRKAGGRDVYMVYGAEKQSSCEFRASGKVELWNPFDGTVRPLPVLSQAAGITRLAMPLTATEPQLIVFSEGTAQFRAGGPEAPIRAVAVEGDWDFELKPTLDNRFGDFRLPVEQPFIGAEARRFRYSDEGRNPEGWSNAQFDDRGWQSTTYSYGPRFWKLGPVNGDAEITTTSIDPLAPVQIAGKSYSWSPYEYSLRWGIENDPGHQGYHGLKGAVPDDFIALGQLVTKSTTTNYVAEATGSRYYLWSTVLAPVAGKARILQGGDLPSAAWVNGARVALTDDGVQLREGANTLLLRYDKAGKGYFVLEDAASPRDWKQTYPLATSWYNRPGLLAYDTRPQEPNPAGWYRFVSPPGMRGFRAVVRGTLAAWANGVPMKVRIQKHRRDGSVEYYALAAAQSAAPVPVALRVEQQRGSYAGAALPEPVAFDCGPGRIQAGDWSLIDGLSSYSGGAWYRKKVKLTGIPQPGSVWLDLGSVAGSVEVRVNGQRAGIKVAPPWRVDLSRWVRPGENRIELLIYNTLANHYQTIPSRYRGLPVSGLLGPVRIEYFTPASER